jgi:hypothetical protein
MTPIESMYMSDCALCIQHGCVSQQRLHIGMRRSKMSHKTTRTRFRLQMKVTPTCASRGLRPHTKASDHSPGLDRIRRLGRAPSPEESRGPPGLGLPSWRNVSHLGAVFLGVGKGSGSHSESTGDRRKGCVASALCSSGARPRAKAEFGSETRMPEQRLCSATHGVVGTPNMRRRRPRSFLHQRRRAAAPKPRGATTRQKRQRWGKGASGRRLRLQKSYTSFSVPLEPLYRDTYRRADHSAPKMKDQALPTAHWPIPAPDA